VHDAFNYIDSEERIWRNERKEERKRSYSAIPNQSEIDSMLAKGMKQ
jgi:hypothetical protein